MLTVRLIDGTEVSSASEAWRHECEARYILALPTLEARRAWLADISAKRGAAAAEHLQHTIQALWAQRQAAA